MPAETIYGDSGDVDLRVSWGGTGMETVQIITQAAARPDADEPTERMIAIVNDWLKAADMPLVDLAELKRKCPHPIMFDGWWMTIPSWSALNRLIKVLQRARDHSFGPPA